MKRLFKKYRKHIWSYIIFASLIVVGALALLNYRMAQAGFVYPNIYVGDINFGGRTQEETKIFLNKKIQVILEHGLIIRINNKDLNFSLREYGADPDLSRELVKFDATRTTDELYAFGRSKFNLFANFKNTLASILTKEEMRASVEFADKELLGHLDDKLKQFETPAKNAAIAFSDGEIKILDETPGLKLDYAKLLKELRLQLQNLQAPYIVAELVIDEPTIKKYEVADRLPEIEQSLSRAPFTIKYNDKTWAVSRETLKKYLDFEKQDGVASLVISKDKSAPFFKEITEAINVPAMNARFEIKDEKVVEFQTSQLGLALDEEETRKTFNSILLDGYPAINAIVRDSPPEITTDNANSLGISALLGKGESDFTGSPPNRIHNIKTGAAKINGILIKPDEEFSLLKAIGEVDGEHGFKQELVIKEDRTTPEFGGGLCQIGTTVFRTALAAGLPITERKSHSYRVAYYEPAGTDATIYNPSPDLKFINDTPGYILVQTKVLNTALSFEFWGKSDGREVNRTNPVIYNIAAAPAPRYIETANFAAGAKKKIETAHKGADAYFKYTVKYPDERGEVSKTFYSHYRPWGEVWLVGLPAGQAGATSTPAQTPLETGQTKNAP